MISEKEIRKLMLELKTSERVINFCMHGWLPRKFCLRWLKDKGYREEFIKYVMAQREKSEKGVMGTCAPYSFAQPVGDFNLINHFPGYCLIPCYPFSLTIEISD